MSDNQKLKIGFIVTGNIARGGHLNHLSRWDDVDLVASCEISEVSSVKTCSNLPGEIIK